MLNVRNTISKATINDQLNITCSDTFFTVNGRIKLLLWTKFSNFWNFIFQYGDLG